MADKDKIKNKVRPELDDDLNLENKVESSRPKRIEMLLVQILRELKRLK